MATKKLNDGISVKVTKDAEFRKEPTVRVIIPLEEDQTGGEVEIDQTETVVINGNVTRIKRGEYVDVKVPVFLQLRQRYPNL